MSASKEKQLRTAERNEGTSKKAEAAAEQARKNKKFMRTAIIFIACVVVLLVAALIINSNLLYKRTTALEVGNVKYSPAEVSYYYRNAAFSVYNDLCDTYGQETVDTFFNPSSSLRDQYYSEDASWADMILETAVNDMERIAVYNDAAEKAGYTLTETGETSVRNSILTMQSYAETNGFKSIDKFLGAYFGKGVDYELFSDLTRRTILANEYATYLQNSLTYTDDELFAYYEEHADEMNYYNFYSYSVSPTLSRFEDMEDEEKDEAMREAAEHIAEALDADGFISRVHEVSGNENFISMNHNTVGGIATYYADWITDPERKAGDTTVVDMDGTYAALLFIGLDDNNYNSVDFRHILIKPEADEDGVITQEALDQCLTRVQNLAERWEKDPTTDNFSLLCAEFSEDTGSSNTGGLYTGVVKNSMVEGINDFIFDPTTQPGDTAICYGESSAYSGYHFVYFDGENRNVRALLSETLLKNEDFNALYDDISKDFTEVQQNKAMKFANIY